MEESDGASFVRELCGCADCLKKTKEEEEVRTKPLNSPSTELAGRLDYDFQLFKARFQPQERQVKPKHLKICTMFFTVDMGCPLDLKGIAQTTWNVEDIPKKSLHSSHRLLMRIRRPQCTASIFTTGRISCRGTKSTSQARVAARRFARILQKAGMPVHFLNFTVNSMMALGRTFPVRLQELALCLQDCSFKPGLFPTLHYKVAPHITATIFSSGRVKLSGCKKETELNEAFSDVHHVVSVFRSFSRLRNRKGAKR